MPIYGLKLLTDDGRSQTERFDKVHYPIEKWVTVPGNGAYVAMTSNLYSESGGARVLLVQMECEQPTGADAPDGVECFRRVRRLKEIDMRWVKTLSNEIRWIVAAFGTDAHRDALLNDPEWWVRWAVARYGTDRHRNALLNDPDDNVRQVARRTAVTHELRKEMERLFLSVESEFQQWEGEGHQ